MKRALAAAGAIAGTVLALAGCSGPAKPAPAAATTPSSTTSPEAVDMTCESIMRPSFVDQLKDLGWVVRPSTFHIGEHAIDGGIQCVWGDEAGIDSGQMYGWAPLDEDTSLDMQQYLEDNGWIRTEDDEYVYLNEDPALGYAQNPEDVITYQFAHGWVALADSKSGLALVTWRG